ncbi:MAG: MauE/DoxX family redox-associated membrane protein, partial [Pseudomonadota bacterium]
ENAVPAAASCVTATHQHHAMVEENPGESLYPLFLIVGFIAGVTLLVAVSTGDWSAEPLIRHFMAGFFIVFSFFKLLDPPGFVSAYRGYDLIARKIPAWGWAYPFVELTLGVAYLLAWVPIATNAITLVLMLVGAAGVLKALLDKRAIRCACLGTALNLPMTKVTLVEDLTMAAMAAVMLGLML